MTSPQGHSTRQSGTLLLAAFCLIYLAAIWAFHLGSAAVGCPAFRDQHLGAALLYAKNGIDLLHPVIPGFNAAGTPTPLEIPFWQAAAALAIRATGGWWGGANIASLLFFSSCLIPLFLLARQWLGSTGAWWTTLFFLAQPVVFLQAGVASTDGASLASLVWFLFAVDGVIRKQTRAFFALALVTGLWCAVSKLPFFIEAGLASGLMLIWHAPKSLRAWIMVAAVGIAGAAALFFWARHVDAMLDLAEFRYRGLTLSEIPWFYFGDLKYRLTPINYVRAGWIFLNALFGSFVLLSFFVWGVWISRKSWGWALALGFVVVALIFFKLVFTHKHYYLMLTPTVALLCAAAATDIIRRLSHRNAMHVLAVIFAPLLFLSTIQGLMGLEVFGIFDPYAKQIANIIRQNTGTQSHLLIAGGGWGGDMLIRAGREGLSIDSTAFLRDPANRKRLAELGYDTFVSISESPLLDAVQRTNPGSFSRKRITWQEATSPVDDNWPVIYSDENVVIKKINWDSATAAP